LGGCYFKPVGRVDHQPTAELRSVGKPTLGPIIEGGNLITAVIRTRLPRDVAPDRTVILNYLLVTHLKELAGVPRFNADYVVTTCDYAVP
jgi:hypothetical protein